MNKKGCAAAVLLSALVLALALAGWAGAEDTFKVYYHYNYQDAPAADSVQAAAGKPLSKPADPAREGYRFLYWSPNIVGSREYDFSAPVTENLRLFAIWAPTAVTVTFQLQAPGLDSVTSTVAVGEAIAPIAAPVWEGYEFGGWFLNAAGTRPFDFSQPAGTETVTTLILPFTRSVSSLSVHSSSSFFFSTVRLRIALRL